MEVEYYEISGTTVGGRENIRRDSELRSKRQSKAGLHKNNVKWTCDLAFLTDLTEHLDVLDLSLQEFFETVIHKHMFSFYVKVKLKVHACGVTVSASGRETSSANLSLVQTVLVSVMDSKVAALMAAQRAHLLAPVLPTVLVVVHTELALFTVQIAKSSAVSSVANTHGQKETKPKLSNSADSRDTVLKVVVITEDVQNVHLLLEYRPHIDVSLTCEHDPKLQEYCVCPQNMPQFDSEGIPNQAPETNKPMILNGPTSRNREG
ncbi:hypothetical protein ANN_09457 [Periplaneta americana]|uniref:Uncharacterized protein n=1 Tax=Periplaneta americana TaxID=6978 RepID=A0ABQ8TPY9_PERAM|nr:hypothetical protein ANN_09457 [Periplaneta americana]